VASSAEGRHPAARTAQTTAAAAALSATTG
jgi:hypothetical protein